MKYLLILITVLFSFLTLSQDETYPKIKEIDGKTVVIFTMEQAQKIDTDYELLEILKKDREVMVKSDSVCLMVINEKDQIISKQNVLISEMDNAIQNKDNIIFNLNKKVAEYIIITEKNKELIMHKDESIESLNKAVRKQRIGIWTGGSVGVILVGILVYSFVK